MAVLIVAVSARMSVPVPGSEVPQSLQTLAVVLVGAWLGPRYGGLAAALYLALGAVGLPVYADGAGGAAHLLGPTAGYLVGFVLAAVFVGWGVGVGGARGRLIRAFLVMALAHLLILALGWLRLSLQIGASEALQTGVLPFLWGGVLKSGVGAAIWWAWDRRRPAVDAQAGLAS
jgi:biotin transport system substrate-specific component